MSCFKVGKIHRNLVESKMTFSVYKGFGEI